MSLSIRVLTGAALHAVLDDVARLRVSVFREFPYLRDAAFDSERGSLGTYEHNDDAVLVGAFDEDRIVGAATGAPMEDHAEAFGDAMERAAIPIARAFYLAESVLLPGYRGRGVGHRFFDLREAHARGLGRAWTVFSAAHRPDDHPLRPPDHRALSPFWRARGYAPLPGIVARARWKDVDEDTPSTKTLQVWARAL